MTAQETVSPEAVFVNSGLMDTVILSGVVRDGGVDGGAKHGYPLYAKITLTSSSGQTVIYSDPFTGAYEISIETGVEYTLTVEAQLDGYQIYQETFTAEAAVTKDFDLLVKPLCESPGYARGYNIFYDFEESEQGFTFDGENTSWAWGEIKSGPRIGHSGINGIATNLNGRYTRYEDGWAMSPILDFSGYTDKAILIEWWDWLFTENKDELDDAGSVEVTSDGENWTVVWGPFSRWGTQYEKQQIVLGSEYLTENFQFRFYFVSDGSIHRDGWYVDDIGISIVDVPSDPIHVVTYHFDQETEAPWTKGQTGTGANSWAQGAPTGEPPAIHEMPSSPNVWATNLGGFYNNNEVSFITSPIIDLSQHENKGILLEYWDWLQTESETQVRDNASIWASSDGGETFDLVSGLITRWDPTSEGYKRRELVIDPEYATEGFALRFQFTSDYSSALYGWYIDDVSLTLYEPVFPSCIPVGGGIVAGYVYDRNEVDEDVILLNALIETETSSALTLERPDDPDNNGLYYMYQDISAEPSDIGFTVSKDKYGTIEEIRSLNQSVVNRQDFRIGAGWLVSEKESIVRSMYLNDDDEFETLPILNQGFVDVFWRVNEVGKGFQPISIPAFQGELVRDLDEVISMTADTSHVVNTLNMLETSSKPVPIELMGGSMAYVIELRSEKGLFRIPDLEQPGNWEKLAPVQEYYYGGDFLGTDFSKIYVVKDTNDFYTIEIETGNFEHIGKLSIPNNLTVNGISGADGFFYALASDCSSSLAYIMTLTPTGGIELIPTAPIPCGIDIAYVPDNGMLYVVDITTDHLFSVDPDTGETIDIGALGFNAGFAQGMDYDEESKILYWAAYTGGGNGQLRIIDLETGASALVGPFPGDNESDCLAIAAGGFGDGIPWLEENPTTGTVGPGETQNIQLRFTTQGVISQPGDYFGELRFKTDSPKETASVPVTLHVWRPYNWGNLKGTVYATEKCDLNPSPIRGARVSFYRDDELVKTVETDENGKYNYSLLRGTYDIEVARAGYVTTRVDDIVLGNSDDIVIDFTLRHDSACLTVEPNVLHAEMYPNQLFEMPIVFRNTGAREIAFDTLEIPGEGPVPYFGKDIVELKVDDDSSEATLGLGGNAQFIVVNRFTPEPEQFPFTIDEILIIFVESINPVSLGDPFEVYVYQSTNPTDDPAVGSEFLYKQAATIEVIDEWQVIKLDEPIRFEGPGDVSIGAGFLKKPGVAYNPATLDITAPQGRSWAGWYSGDIPETPTLPPDANWLLLDGQLASNVMLRAYGETGGEEPGDIPWLSLDPTAGVVSEDGGEVEVTAFFTTEDLTWGDYFGTIRVLNPPDPKFNIPVQLRVLPFNMMYLPLVANNFSFPQN